MRPLRVNILLLVGYGYACVTIGFVALWMSGMDAAGAFDTVKDPLMTLVGGSLALAHQVLEADNPNKD